MSIINHNSRKKEDIMTVHLFYLKKDNKRRKKKVSSLPQVYSRKIKKLPWRTFKKYFSQLRIFIMQ